MSYFKKLSKTSAMHYIKLVFRSFLLVAATVIYLYDRFSGNAHLFTQLSTHPLILSFIWLVFTGEMILRFFPSSLESRGCQKQFAKNFEPAPENHCQSAAVAAHKPTKYGVHMVVIFWVILNGLIGVLYFNHIIDNGILFLIALTYSVCDMICILFFCPFQQWMMKNKCCGTCRIYNWDFAMMFTPLIFIKSWFTWSLVAIALVLLIQWEVLYRLHPERFDEATNYHLACANCTEKLCSHKKALRGFLAQQRLLLKNKEKEFFS